MQCSSVFYCLFYVPPGNGRWVLLYLGSLGADSGSALMANDGIDRAIHAVPLYFGSAKINTTCPDG
jgi:hypothetical protein